MEIDFTSNFDLGATSVTHCRNKSTIGIIQAMDYEDETLA